jgi:hypothetical protein
VGGCLSRIVYLGLGVLADWGTGIYFSIVSMTTVGYSYCVTKTVVGAELVAI